MKNIKISVNTIHFFEGKEEAVTYKVEAILQQFAEFKQISYIDPAIEDKQSIVVMKYNDKELRIIREGSIKSELVFQPRGTSFGSYEFQGLVLEMKPILLDYNIEDDFIKINYDLLINNQDSGNFDVEVKILSDKAD